jgi:hypothetical protein
MANAQKEKKMYCTLMESTTAGVTDKEPITCWYNR